MNKYFDIVLEGFSFELSKNNLIISFENNPNIKLYVIKILHCMIIKLNGYFYYGLELVVVKKPSRIIYKKC